MWNNQENISFCAIKIHVFILDYTIKKAMNLKYDECDTLTKIPIPEISTIEIDVRVKIQEFVTSFFTRRNYLSKY